MVDTIEAYNIAKEVSRRYGQGIDFKVISKDDLVNMDIDKMVWEKMKYVPPAFYDFKKIYMVSPDQNWPDYDQIDMGAHGLEGTSRQFCFYLIVKEIGHKTFIPGFVLQKAMEKQILEEVQAGWSLYQPYFDGMIVDVLTMKSPFVKQAFKDYPAIMTNCVVKRWYPKIKHLFSNGEDIVTWEEIVARISVAAAESEIPGKDPEQPDGILWPGLKKTSQGKAQMKLIADLYPLVIDLALAASKHDLDTVLRLYKDMAHGMHVILGDNASRILPPLPLQVVNEKSDISGLGFINSEIRARALLSEINDERQRMIKKQQGGKA